MIFQAQVPSYASFINIRWGQRGLGKEKKENRRSGSFCFPSFLTIRLRLWATIVHEINIAVKEEQPWIEYKKYANSAICFSFYQYFSLSVSDFLSRITHYLCRYSQGYMHIHVVNLLKENIWIQRKKMFYIYYELTLLDLLRSLLS